MQESAVERYLANKVKQAGGWPLKFVSPGTSGVPDRLVLLPGGRLIFVETKRPGEEARALQKAVHRKLRDLGFAVLVIDWARRSQDSESGTSFPTNGARR